VPNKTVLFIVDTGGEEQCVRRAGSTIVPESERPQSIKEHKRIVGVGVPHEADEFMREAVECSDPSAAEVAHENGVAELAEIASGPPQHPRAR